LSNDLLTNGSLGAFNAATAIKKSSSNEFVYTFNASWTYTTTSGQTGIISNGPEEYAFLNLNQLNLSNNENVIIKPNYLSTTRLYTIRFYNQGTLFAE
jgi:hypothetical protein